MQINELSKLTGVNAETIRMYRKKGLLKPLQKDNNYYNYTQGDFVSLVYLRKLRELNFNLDDITNLYSSDQTVSLSEKLEDKELELEEEIDLLKEKITFLQLEHRHSVEMQKLLSSQSSAAAFQSLDEKIDFYDINPSLIANLSKEVHDFYFCSTPSIFVSKDVLNGPIEDRSIPLKVGVGTYRKLLNDVYTIPENTVIIPNGISVGESVFLDQLDTINIRQLEPMMNLADALGKRFISDMTGYLYGINTINGKRVFSFRVRACIEQNDIADQRLDEYKASHNRKAE